MSRDLTRPIIVTGTLRSGVRLLAAVLDERPELTSGPELPFIHTIVRQARHIETQIGANLARHHGIGMPELRGLFRDLIADLLEARCAAQAGRVVLHSFAAATALEDYAALLPQARFVFLVRDVRAVAASLRRCDWRDPRTGAALPYTSDVAAGARHARDTLELARPSIRRLAREGLLIGVRYETLCRDPAAEGARLARFLEIAAAPMRVRAESAARVTAATEYLHPPLRPGPVTPQSVNAWRAALSDTEITTIDGLTHGMQDPLCDMQIAASTASRSSART